MPSTPDPSDISVLDRLHQGWTRMLSIADEGREAPDALRRRLLLLCMLLTTASLAGLIVAELLWGGSDQWIFLSGMLLLLMAATFDYTRAGRYEFYSHLLVGGLTTLVVILIVASGGQSRAPQLSLPTLAIVAALLLRPRAVVLWATAMLAVMVMSHQLRQNGAPVHLPLNPVWLEGAVERVGSVLIVVSVLLGTWCIGLVAQWQKRVRLDSGALRAAQAGQRDAEQRLEQFVEMASAWFWETDEQHRMVYLSSGFEKATGVAPAQALGLTPAEVMRIRYPNAAAAESTMRPMIERRGFKDQLLSWHEPLTGVINHYANSATPIYDVQGGFRGFRGRVINISERAETIRQVRESVQGDFLTGLMSRRGMLEALDHALIRLRDADQSGWWIQVDLDRFHDVNTQLNYAQGDRFLKRFARSLGELVGRHDALSRIDGDDFGILLLQGTKEDVQQLAVNIMAIARGLRMEFLGSEAGTGSASLGAATISRATPSVTALLQATDAACQRARHEGGARLHFAS